MLPAVATSAAVSQQRCASIGAATAGASSPYPAPCSMIALLKVTDIFLYIKGYLNPESFRSLCNCSVELQDEKWRFVSWKLTREASLEFQRSSLDDPTSFRSKLLKHLNDPRIQLSLDFSRPLYTYQKLDSKELTDVSALGDVYALDLT